MNSDIVISDYCKPKKKVMKIKNYMNQECIHFQSFIRIFWIHCFHLLFKKKKPFVEPQCGRVWKENTTSMCDWYEQTPLKKNSKRREDINEYMNKWRSIQFLISVKYPHKTEHHSSRMSSTKRFRSLVHYLLVYNLLNGENR